jgi:glycosyltransferase involved in cell wall biosynthesis
LVEEKGIELLLQAVARLEGDWRLNLVGSGPLKARLETLTGELGMSERIAWMPWIASTEMPGQYTALDVLVVPSLTRPNWKEQFGRVLIEAMASAVPVIGSDSGAIPDIIADAGFVVPEGDVAALTEALCKIHAESNLREKLARAGRQRVLAHFTHEQVAAATVKVYQTMLAGG